MVHNGRNISLIESPKRKVEDSQEMTEPNFLLLDIFHVFKLVKVSDEVNGTISRLNLIPAVEDDNRMVTCRAQTPLLSGGFSEGELRMQVYCKYIFYTS